MIIDESVNRQLRAAQFLLATRQRSEATARFLRRTEWLCMQRRIAERESH